MAVQWKAEYVSAAELPAKMHSYGEQDWTVEMPMPVEWEFVLVPSEPGGEKRVRKVTKFLLTVWKERS